MRHREVLKRLKEFLPERNLQDLVSFIPWKGQSRLVVEYRRTSLSLALFQGEEVKGFEKILLRETTDESLRSSVTRFLGKARPTETLLLLPRSEVLSKEFLLTDGRSAVTKEVLAAKLEEVLPYSPQEMAFGVSLETATALGERRGLVLAVPEAHLSATLSLLKGAGLSIDEVTTEDQALLWWLLEKGETGPLVLLDEGEERILALFVREGKISLCRSFAKNMPEETSSLAGISEEISLSLLESKERPEKVILSGSWSPEAQAEISRDFALPVERLSSDALNPSVPISLEGGRLYGRYPVMSLLPRQDKIRRLERQRKRLVQEVFAAMGLFVGAVLLAFSVHLAALDGQEKRLTAEVESRAAEVAEIEKRAAVLQVFSDTQTSKEKFLQFLRELSKKWPSGVELRELRIDGCDIGLKAESPSHDDLSEIVQVLEDTAFVKGAKLEHTRLRRRPLGDSFQFEVTGRCQG